MTSRRSAVRSEPLGLRQTSRIAGNRDAAPSRLNRIPSEPRSDGSSSERGRQIVNLKQDQKPVRAAVPSDAVPTRPLVASGCPHPRPGRPTSWCRRAGRQLSPPLLRNSPFGGSVDVGNSPIPPDRVGRSRSPPSPDLPGVCGQSGVGAQIGDGRQVRTGIRVGYGTGSRAQVRH